MKKLQDLKTGEVFKYGCLDWIKLDDIENGTLTIMKDKLPDTRRFNGGSNNWRNSKLRNWLNQNFLHELIDNGAKKDDFLWFERDLTAEDGTKGYGFCADRLSLITCEEYRKYRNLMPIIDNWWWTLTPYSCMEKYSRIVHIVHYDGSLDWHHVSYDIPSVRPICNLKSEIMVSNSDDEVNKDELVTQITEDITQRILNVIETYKQEVKE